MDNRIYRKYGLDSRIITIFLLGIIGLSSFLVLSRIGSNAPSYSSSLVVSLPRSADSITASNVELDKSSVYRGIDAVNITYDNYNETTGTTIYDATTVDFIAKITLSDSSTFNLTLSQVGTSNLYSVLYTPSITNATGTASILILAVDKNTGLPVGTETETDATVEVLNNIPLIGVVMNTTEIYRGNSLLLNFTPSDIEDAVVDLTWQVEIYRADNTFLETLVPETNSIFSHEMFFPTDSLTYYPGTYYINATISDTDGAERSYFYYFTIKNNEPIIETLSFLIDGQAPTEELSIYRGSQVLTVNVQCSDVESNETLRLKITAYDPVTAANILFPAQDYENILPVNSSGFFTTNITFPLSMSVGVVILTVTVFEIIEGETYSDTLTEKIIVKNNPPEVTALYLNGKTNEDIQIYSDEMMNFTCNVTDAENTIAFLEVALLYQENDEIKWFNYTVEYSDENTTIQIRAMDLPSGTYMAYAIAYDKDGGIGKIAEPLYFELHAEKRQDPTVWLMLGIGFVLGAVIGILSLYWRYRAGTSRTSLETKEASVSAPKKEKTKGSKKVSKTPSSKKKSSSSEEEQPKEEKRNIEEKKKESSSSKGKQKPSKSKKSKVIRRL